jgi:hypothetical protein
LSLTSDDFPSADVHSEALVGGLLSPFFQTLGTCSVRLGISKS